MRLLPHLMGLLLLFLSRGGLLAARDPIPCPSGSTALRWETFGETFFFRYCNRCHGWNNYTDVWTRKDLILEQVVAGNMPPFETVPPEEIDRLSEWMRCDLPVDGSCPTAGSEVTHDNFAAKFLEVHCGSCHWKSREGEARQGAPLDQNWDDPAALRAYALPIRDTLLRNQMPPDLGLSPSPDVDRLLEWIACGLAGLPEKRFYRRGDANSDGFRDITDAVTVLLYLFEGTAPLRCFDAADIDGSGKVEVTDAVNWLNFLFLGGTAPPEPFRDCGDLGRLGCEQFSGC